MNDERAMPPDSAEDAQTAAGAELDEVAPAGAATTVAAPGLSRRRWTVAAIMTAVVLAGSVLLASLLAGRSTPEVLRYVSSDAFIVFEFRPELPGDQRAKIGELLSHFPGFKDQSTLDRKIDESLDLVVNRLSDGETNYYSDVKPYLGGPAVVAVRGFQNDASGEPPFVLVATTDGSADCHFPKAIQTHAETYEGLEIRVADSGVPISCAIDGRYAIVGPADAVRKAIDTKRSGHSVADDEAYRAAQASLAQDHVGAVFVNARLMLDQVTASSPAAGDLAAMREELPAWFAAQVRGEDDALVMSGISPIPADAPAPPGADHASDLAKRIPGTAIAAFEGHDLGASIKLGLAELAKNPATADIADQIEAAATTIGGLDNLTGWMGDVAVVATLDGEAPGGGIVLEANDEAKAAATLASIRNLIVLAGTGSEIHLDQVDHDGTTIYVVDLGDLSSLLGAPAGTEPQIAGTNLALAFAQRDDLVVIGVTQAFVEAVLGTQVGASLADNPRYQHAIGRAGETNRGQGYVDLAAILQYVRSEMTGDAAANWDANIGPWISPFEGVAFSVSRDGVHMRGRVAITVR